MLILNKPPSSLILSTAYLPPVEYFYFLNNYENIRIDIHENFQKQTYRNRCVIYSPNGPLSLVIPVIRPDKPKTIVKDILISYDEEWPRTHWRSITAAYNSSPFFLYYQDDLHRILEKKYKYLIDLNNDLLSTLLSELKINISYKSSEEYLKGNNYLDLRERISPKRIKNDSSAFPEYNQVFIEKHGFLPNLSIIDLLFNEGPNCLEYLSKINLQEGEE